MFTWRFEIHDVLASTLDYCRQKILQNEEAGFVVIAHEQRAGRGTRGRKWSGGRGNLALNFLLYDDEKKNLLSVLPFMTALALYDACLSYVPAVYKKEHENPALFQLKWPNDLLLNGGKMAGILIESGHNDKGKWLSVGVGVNLCSAPEIAERKTAFFAELGPAPHLVLFAKMLMNMMREWLIHWQEEGNDAIYKAWLKRAHPVGTKLRIVNTPDVMNGSFSGIDSYGRLLLRLDRGDIVSVATGDIFCV